MFLWKSSHIEYVRSDFAASAFISESAFSVFRPKPDTHTGTHASNKEAAICVQIYVPEFIHITRVFLSALPSALCGYCAADMAVVIVA